MYLGLLGGSAGKESACNAGDPRLIPGLGISPGEGNGYPLQYSWASLVAQIKESTCSVGDLGLIPGLGRCPGGWQPTPVFLSGESSWTEEPDRLWSMGLQRVGHD